MAKTQAGAATARPTVLPGGPRRTRMIIRKVGPFSVLRMSLFFYFCLFLIFYFAVWIVYAALESTKVLTTVGDFLGTLDFGCPPHPAGTQVKCTVTFHQGWIFSRLFIVGVVLVVVWSIINLLVALLYNLVSDVIGGIQVTLGEKQ